MLRLGLTILRKKKCLKMIIHHEFESPKKMHYFGALDNEYPNNTVYSEFWIFSL
jgi:hypothetical protein